MHFLRSLRKLCKKKWCFCKLHGVFLVILPAATENEIFFLFLFFFPLNLSQLTLPSLKIKINQ